MGHFRRTFTALAPLAILLSSALSAQSDRPKDVPGWGKIQWGMTLDQVRAAYGPETKASDDPYWSHLTLPPVTVGDIPLQVSVSAKKPSAQVTLVILSCYFGFTSDTPGVAPNVTPRDFDGLKALMIQKYGHPRNEERRIEYNDRVRVFLWTFTSTTIELKLAQSADNPELGSMHVEYRAADPKSLDAL